MSVLLEFHWHPWSEWRISGLPCFSMASSRTDMTWSVVASTVASEARTYLEWSSVTERE